MNLQDLITTATDKTKFLAITNYIDFCRHYLDFISTGLQAVIVAQNEPNYRFFQYREEGHFNITRPINADLMYGAEMGTVISRDFLPVLRHSVTALTTDYPERVIIQNAIYTIQQTIGATLDALPAGRSNTARKINGDLFERFIRLLLQEVGVVCKTGVIHVPVVANNSELFSMNYQHDLLVYSANELKMIGSIKTSSKDRLDKIFLDKFLYNRLTETQIPHIAIFLNDVQRKQTARANKYSINSTFLSGHFKGYSIKLNPLDGVYYCDIRPNMRSDEFLSQHIQTIDHFFCDDLRHFVAK